MTKSLHRLLYLSLPLLAACSALEPAPDATDTAPAPPESVASEPVASTEEPVEYGNFTGDQLERALLSEFGGMRGYLPQAAENYYELALETSDPGIIRRAVEFASATGNNEALIQLAQLWLQQEPDALDPHLIVGYELLEQALYVRALPHLDQVLTLGGNVDFTAMTARTFSLDNRQREIIADELENMLSRHPDEATLYYALAQLYDQSGDTAGAGEILAIARERFGDNPRTALIEAQLLQNAGLADDAETLLGDAVTQYPTHRLLRYSYAQILVQNEKLREAAIHFTELLRLAPGDLETLYSLALINLELEEYELAEDQLQTLLSAGHRNNEAHFYLAVILEAREDLARALSHYQQIGPRSNAFLSAQRQIMRLFVALERFDDATSWRVQRSAATPDLGPILPALEAEALINAGFDDRADAVLDEALASYPDNIDLLFARTLLSEQQNDMPQVEKDLLRIIDLDPDNARALNHLGYALTVRTDRYDEALDLIQRAIAITPDDPAIIDSLGWVQYKLGRLDEALANLKTAYAAFPDAEVAAHLGEVLWMLEEQDEALEIWREALEQQPDSEHVLDTMDRLVPSE
ncbi:MAG: tetratricopeptide repeat protein [Pseudohongiella sp.]|uniref:tetratricopeptide repeat protein n=1 Tax=Pseudohongiella sp. TaxID=1979412 RepID=UPI0034A029E1